MSCCDGIIKYLLFFFNLVFSLFGLTLIITGSVLMYQSSGFSDILKDIKSGFLAPQIILVVLGIVIFVSATLGCCGAIQGNRCKLITYAVFLLSLFIVEVAVGIYVAINMTDIMDLVTKNMHKYFDVMFKDEELQKVFHNMERFLHCCGVTSHVDYTIKDVAVPQSCCADNAPKCSRYWDMGCATAVTDVSTNSGKIIAGMGIAVALIEIIAAAFALRLASLVQTAY